ncbi:MAG: sensor histidine kinase [Planctomycetota bacterium]|jgi:PAS domain S-box-containing protein
MGLAKLLEREDIPKDVREVLKLEITERKRVEEELLKFKTISDKASYGSAIADMDGNLLYVNETFALMHGYEQEELAGEHLSIFHSAAQMQKVRELFTTLINEGSYSAEEVWHVDRDGNEIPTLMNAVVIMDDRAKPLYLSATAIEITEHKRAERELKKSQQELKSITSASMDFIAKVDLDFKIQFANRTRPDLIKEKVIGTSVFDFIFEDDRPLAKAVLEDVKNTGTPSRYETRFLCKEGDLTYYESIVSPIGQRGNITGLTIITRDITERKKAEETLSKSEKMLRTIFDNATDGIVLADIETQMFFSCNRALCGMLGYTEDELKQLGVQNIHPKEDLPYVKEQFEKQARGEIIIAKDIPVLRKDGSVFYTEINSSPILLGNKSYLLGLFRDITERRQAEEEVLRYRDALGKLASELTLAEEKERQRIAEGLHEDIAQRIFGARLMLELVQEELKPSDKDQVKKSKEVLSGLMDSIRDLSFEFGTPVLYQLGLEAAIQQHIESFSKKHRIPCFYEDDGLDKSLDDNTKLLIFRAVRELLANAAGHAKVGTIKITYNRKGNEVHLLVEDDGIGFDPKDTDSRMFDSKSFGLFSIGERMKQLGGKIIIDSEPGKGTKITLVAPLV